MTAPLDSLARTLTFHDKALVKLTRRFERDDWLARLNDGAAHPYWMLCHLTACRAIMLDAAGENADDLGRYRDRFSRGSTPGDETPVALDEARDDFHAAGRRLAEAMRRLDQAAIDQPIERTFPDGSDTLAGMLHFMIGFHEPYHLGQISAIAHRRGKGGLG